jgi:ElaB/YqjD/DUF883 family membrane-anchored ribosome-binding protein
MPSDTPQASDMTQQSGYTPASEMRTEMDRPERGKMQREGEQAVKESASKTRETAGKASERVKDTASQAGRKAQETIDRNREPLADEMESAATRAREHAQGREGFQAQASARVADTMEKGAGYLREHDTQDMMEDLEKFVREHPVQALAGAIVGGFIIGRALH